MFPSRSAALLIPAGLSEPDLRAPSRLRDKNSRRSPLASPPLLRACQARVPEYASETGNGSLRGLSKLCRLRCSARGSPLGPREFERSRSPVIFELASASASAGEERERKKGKERREEKGGGREGRKERKERKRTREREREREREVRMWVRVALSGLKFESRRFLSRRNESPCTRAAKVPGSRAGTPSYYFYGPETSAGIIIISPGRGQARSSALLHRLVCSSSSSSSSSSFPACYYRYYYYLHGCVLLSSFARSLPISLSLSLSLCRRFPPLALSYLPHGDDDDSHVNVL